MYFRIFLSSFGRVLLSSDDFVQSYRLSKRVSCMNPGHVKDVHDVKEVAIVWLMNFEIREVCFFSKYPPQNGNGLFVSFVYILILSLIILCNNDSSLSSSRGGALIYVNIFSVTFGFDPRPVSSRNKSTLSSNLLHHLKQVHD